MLTNSVTMPYSCLSRHNSFSLYKGSSLRQCRTEENAISGDNQRETDNYMRQATPYEHLIIFYEETWLYSTGVLQFINVSARIA